MLAKIRQHQTAWARRVLALFAVVWVSMAIQPCAMAMGDDSDCPHCPPAMVGEHHDGQMSSGAMPCMDGGDCDNFDQFNYDGRSAKLKFEPALVDLFVGAVSLSDLMPANRRDEFLPLTFDDGAGPGIPPPLNVLYCVYLD